jgi:hypothetical protein
VCGGPLEADGTACDLDISDPCSEEAACVAGECISMVERLCPAIDACHGPGQCDSATGECTAPVAGVAGLCSGDLCFTDVTREMGWNIAPVGSQHGGSAGAVAIDYNGDNLTDILMVTESDSGAGMESRLLLLENQYSIFVDRTADARLSGYTGVTGVAVADFDNDGWTDIYVLRDGPNQLLRNRGASRDSSSAPVTFLAVARGVDDARRSRAAVFGDYNADGWLDLLVGNDAAFGSEQPAGTANALYRSEGSANFVDVAVSLNVAGAGATNDVLLTDLNKDGRIELLTCNDDALGPVGSALYTWRAGGFVSSTTAWRYASAGRCRSLAVGDYNGDGWLDVYMATTHQNKLLAGGATSFTDVTVDAEAEMSHDRCEPTEELPSWAAAFADLNADGRNEVLVVNGDHESDPCQAQPRSNALLVLQRDGTFDDVAPEAGLADSRPGRSVALLDFDNDGDLDLFVANAGAGSQLLRNERNSGGYLRLWLRGRLSNRDGIGTRLVSTGESSGLRQELEALPSTLSAGRLLLGAPDADTHTLEATWPSGVEQTVFQIPSEPFSTDELHRNPNDLPGYTLVEPRVTVAGIGALSLTGVSLTVPVKLVNHDGNADHAVDVLLEISANDWVRQVTGENLNVVVPAAASVGHEETTLITVELPLDEVDPVAAESFAVNLRITAQDVSAEATSDGLRGIDQHSQDMDIAGL